MEQSSALTDSFARFKNNWKESMFDANYYLQIFYAGCVAHELAQNPDTATLAARADATFTEGHTLMLHLLDREKAEIRARLIATGVRTGIIAPPPDQADQ